MAKVMATPSQTYERRNNILNFIREHGPVDLNQVCAHFGGWPRSSTREWLAGMAESGHIEIVKFNVAAGNTKNVYQHSDNAAPLRPARSPAPNPEPKALPWQKSNQRIVPAKQIGMARDEWVAAIFGPPVAA